MATRRTLIKGSLALPMLPAMLPAMSIGFAGCSDNSPNPYLAANYGPVDIESTVTDLKVTGTIPAELSGRFLRNGPNPNAEQDINPGSYHWFTGRGMVHGLRLDGGQAQWYRNRYVGGSNANTNVIGHAGKTIAIVESGGQAQNMAYDLSDAGGNEGIGGGFSAHPKLDPDTGELHAMCYDWANLRDHVRYVVIGEDGELAEETEIALPGMPMIHDMSLTQNYAVIYDLPVTLSFLALAGGSNLPFRWDDDHEPRVGLLPRGGRAGDIIWSAVQPNYAYHPMNAYEDADGRVVIDICRYERMFLEDVRGPFGDSLPRLDRWTIDPKTQTANEQIIDERPQEFPRCHPDLNGKPYRYGYTVAVQANSFPAIYKHDLRTGTATEFAMGAGRHSAEPVFVPKAGATAEDDGYLMTYVFDEASNTSEFLILDAQDLTRPALAQIQLPVRVPHGFHGNWVPDSVAGPA